MAHQWFQLCLAECHPSEFDVFGQYPFSGLPQGSILGALLTRQVDGVCQWLKAVVADIMSANIRHA